MTFKIFSLGCKVNSYECEAIKYLLLKRGYKSSDEQPDIVLINTCSVTATADQKSRQHIRKFRSLFPDAIIVVMGCYSQGNSDYIKDHTGADIIVGTSNRNIIPDLIEEFIASKKQIVKVDTNPRFFTYEELGINSCSDNARAYLKIQDGCDNFCSYCLIPYRRGKSRSRAFNDVINEAKALVNAGYKEIVLTGIHVGGYGNDLNNINFSTLVEELLKIEGLYRLRISSIEESEIDDHLISLFDKYPNLAKHLHIPLQSGSDAVLKRMNRKYVTAEFLSKINKIKSSCPDICLTTDVIVGFPGETNEEFNQCYEFIKECGFNMLHVFPFSSREGTVASRMKDQISPEVKKARVATLITLSDTLWNRYCDSFTDREVEVLIEENDASLSIMKGHTSNYLEVSVPYQKDFIGKIVKTKYKKNDHTETK